MADKRRSRSLWVLEGLAEFSATDGIIAGLAGAAATMVARKVITVLWTKATGKEPPIHPEDPQVALFEALTWATLTSVTIQAMRLLAIRAAARKKHGRPGREPAGAADG